MADVKWIKICTDIFDDEKILLIESLPDPYAVITVWFKLLCLAGKQNNSGVFMMGKIAYTDKMLATIFRMNEATVKMALQTFEQFEMIEIVEGVITIPNWGKHQNLEQLEERRKYQREYQKEYRKKQKLLTVADDKCLHKHLHEHNVNALDKDIDKEKELDKEIYISIVDYLNQKTGSNYRAKTAKTQSLIKARLNEGFTEEDFKAVIDKKCAEWIGTEWEKYLRPETLFGNKFESYLNAKTATKQNANTGRIADDLDSLDDLF